LGANALTTNVPKREPDHPVGRRRSWKSLSGEQPAGHRECQRGLPNPPERPRHEYCGYLSDSWKIDRWLLDAGARLEHINLTQETSNLSPVQMGSQFDLWTTGRIAQRHVLARQ